MMKISKLLTVIFLCTVLLTVNIQSASAASYIDKQFATLAKKGQLKGASGNVGMTYKALKPKVKGTFSQSESYLWHQSSKASYAFLYEGPKIKQNQKVALIHKDIKGRITAKQLSKYFGKPVAYKVYKAGKYYIRYDSYTTRSNKAESYIQIGTKDGINAWFTVDPDGDLYIK